MHTTAAGDSATIAIRNNEIVALWPGFVDRCLGVAIDIGSTTVAGQLCDLSSGEVLATAGRMNPQIRFGEDLMSRVSYTMMNTDGAAAMTDAIRTGNSELIDELLAYVADDRSTVLDIVAVGNPIMHHLLLGIEPTPLGQAPFPLATANAIDTKAAAIDLQLPSARLNVGPCIAGHVGADTAAASPRCLTKSVDCVASGSPRSVPFDTDRQRV